MRNDEHVRPPRDRLIEWTGERCVPWTDDLQVVYEHYHRYVFAASFVTGKRVLDLASGEGYGCALMAESAGEVVGVDIDTHSVEHARRNYGNTNLTFAVASITDPQAVAESGTFDVITCFEAIEHVAEQDQLLQLVHSRLAPGGLFVSSTPDTAVYRHEHDHENPFHVKELTESEFHLLLSDSFRNVALYRQSVAVGSAMVRSDCGDGAAPSTGTIGYSLRQDGERWTADSGLPHTYLVALASDEPLPELPSGTVIVDPAMTLIGSVAARVEERAAVEVAKIEELYRESRSEVNELKAAIASIEQLRSAAKDDAERVVREGVAREREHEELEREYRLQEHRRAVGLAGLRRDLFELTRDRDAARQQVEDLQHSRFMRIASTYRAGVERALPRGTRRRRAYSTALRLPEQTVESPQSAVPRLWLPTADEPIVSVVIPVHGKWDYTLRCLQSLAAAKTESPFEIVVVDDASPDDTRARLHSVDGVSVVALDANLRFVGACNAGVAASRGSYYVLLNNDTEVTDGWLDALVDTCREPGVGLVGSKLLYPNGFVQEAGGIVFSDGDGWNYGRGCDDSDPRYNYRRSVDYCSGASIVISREAWNAVGGLDERYAPAYYEDTDLAFSIREAGYDVVYQPASRVIHHEGITNGTDVTEGVKSFQVVNRATFRRKWAARLRNQPAHDGSLIDRAARKWYRGIVVIVDHYVPQPDEDAGSRRMFALVGALTSMGYGVIFVPDNRQRTEPYTSDLEALGAEVLYGPIRLEEVLMSVAPLVVLAIVSRPHIGWQYLPTLREHLPNARIAYDTVDLHYVREFRGHEATGDQSMYRRAMAIKELELSLGRASDVVLVVSPVEQAILQRELPDNQIEVVSIIHDRVLQNTSPVDREGLLFVGSFAHPPNGDAVEWFLRDVVPLIRRKRPDIRVRIVGRSVPPSTVQMADGLVEFLGWVPDLTDLYNSSRMSIAPLRYGAGVKGKIGESLSFGLPVVTTTVGAEGMALRDGTNALIADTAADFAASVLRLYEDDLLWANMSAAGLDHIDGQFGLARATRTLESLLQADPVEG